MAELDKLLLQARKLAERIRVLSEEHQAVRIKHQLLPKHTGIGDSSQDRPLDDASTHREPRLRVRPGPAFRHARFWK